MFGSNQKRIDAAVKEAKNAALIDEIADKTIKHPSPITIHVSDDPIQEYERLSKELNFHPAQLLHEQLIDFMAKEGIPKFDYNEVNIYLQRQISKPGTIWIWKPLRERDVIEDWQWGMSYEHGNYRKNWDHRPYDKLVPMEILQDVKKIEDEFGDKLKFFVSDYASPRPDPFIMATELDVPRTIFGMWDEPDFNIKQP